MSEEQVKKEQEEKQIEESTVETGVQEFGRAKRKLDGDIVTVKPYPSGEAKVIDSRGFERHVTADELKRDYSLTK